MEQAQQATDIMPQNLPARIIQWARQNTIQLVAVIFWVVLIVAVRQYMSANDLTFGELVNQLAEVLTGTWYGPLIYIVIYLLRPLILFPASLLTILAGTVFGLAFGFVYALIAGTLSAAIPYAIGRWFSNNKTEDLAEEAADDNANILKRFTDLLKRNPFQAVLTMRLLYLPYDAVSLIVGSLGIGFIPFALATAIGNLGGTLSFVGIGASAEIDFATGEFSVNPLVFLFSITILVVSLGISRYLNQREAAKQAGEDNLASA